MKCSHPWKRAGRLSQHCIVQAKGTISSLLRDARLSKGGEIHWNQFDKLVRELLEFMPNLCLVRGA